MWTPPSSRHCRIWSPRCDAAAIAHSDARQLLLCVYLSGAVFIGLILNSLFGWWGRLRRRTGRRRLAVREGIEAWTGAAESSFDVLNEMNEE